MKNTRTKLVLALTRFAGLRRSCEAALLTKADIDLAAGTIRVCTGKVRRFEAPKYRVIRINPLLRSSLVENLPHVTDGEKIIRCGSVHGGHIENVNRAAKLVGIAM